MILGFITVFASLVLLLVLNWQSLRAMGWERVSRMLLIWLGIIAGLGVILRILGY